MTHKLLRTLSVGSAFLAALALASPVVAGDWPAYRGPNHDGKSTETGILKVWPENGPKQLWSAKLGDGYSGITAVDGRVYTQYGDGESEYAVAFDAATGKRLWRFRTDKDREDRFGSGPRSTPLIEGGRLYALSALGNLHALDAVTGEAVWSVDLQKQYGAKVPTWGVSVSPLVEGNLLLVDAGGKSGHSLLALDTKSGKLVWASETDKPGYSTPVAFDAAGKRQVAFFTGTSVVSVDPKSGKVYWREPWKTEYDVNAAMPIFIAPDKIFVSSGYGVGAAVFQVKASEGGVQASQVWRSQVMKNHFNSSVLVDGTLYGFDDGTLKAIDAATGEERWKERRFADGSTPFQKGSLLYVDGHLLVLSEKGVLGLVEATPAGYKEKGRTEVFQSKTWTMPTLADGRLYLRTEKVLVALDLKG